MKISLDDPNLTAYALGELPVAQLPTMEQAVSQSAEAQEFVRETQQLARMLGREFRAELLATEDKPLNIMPLPGRTSFWSDARWMSIGVAASLALAAMVTVVMLSGIQRGHLLPVAGKNATAAGQSNVAPAEVEVETGESVASEPPPPALNPQAPAEFLREEAGTAALPAARANRARGVAKSAVVNSMQSASGAPHNFNTAEYDHFKENPFLPAAANPLSTFSIDVDTASYANVRRFIHSGALPPKMPCGSRRWSTISATITHNRKPIRLSRSISKSPAVPGSRSIGSCGSDCRGARARMKNVARAIWSSCSTFPVRWNQRSDCR